MSAWLHTNKQLTILLVTRLNVVQLYQLSLSHDTAINIGTVYVLPSVKQDFAGFFCFFLLLKLLEYYEFVLNILELFLKFVKVKFA